jgi:hypothetical protein
LLGNSHSDVICCLKRWLVLPQKRHNQKERGGVEESGYGDKEGKSIVKRENQRHGRVKVRSRVKNLGKRLDTTV